ncbi:hypothetical protein SCALIN_C13_0112 [Candidatus Scalindua japonica]|uniref:PEP-CTERM protein-sorting domain-containing protein n=1 Tax=Candidatus Scalindua japonica TaxID=1284222 RepID=A0A286TXG8_9BACT|nr:hypothetical protein [Candidatus Scalindua japonica]GAX60599.1 hypothetical protein SCALIN_C13_0112 [Candidatus Scalindua japonica]
MLKKLTMAGVFGFALMVLTSNVNAAFVTYTDRTTFEVAAGTVTTENFNEFTTPLSINPKDFGDFTTTNAGANVFVLQGGSHAASVDGTNFIQLRTLTFDKGFNVLFDEGVYAFGFDWRNTDTSGDHIEFGIGATSFDLGAPGSGFFGIVSTETIGKASPFFFSDTDGDGGELVFGAFDNFTYSHSAMSVPEPGIKLLFGISLLGLVGVRAACKIKKMKSC